MNGIDLVPFSSQIRSDLICDTGSVAEQDDNRELLRPIPEWVRETTLTELIPPAPEIICYYGLCALVLVRENEEIEGFLTDFIYPNVEIDRLKVKIKNLLENAAGYSISDLELNDLPSSRLY